MGKHFLLGFMSLTLLVGTVGAQQSKVTTAWSYLQSKDYDKARDAINLAILNDGTKGDAKTWFYRGQAYQGIYSTTEAKLKGDASAKDPEKAKAGRKAYDEYIANNTDLKEAAISYRKTKELDKSKDYDDDNLITVALLFFNDGSNCYTQKRYAAAYDKLEEFENCYEALGKSKKKIDDAFSGSNPPTDIREVKLYMAGCAIRLDQKDKAKKLFEELADSKYPSQAVYVNLSKYYQIDKDTAKAIGALDKGMEALPDSMKGGVLIEKLKILVKQGKLSEATKVAEDAIKHDPKNVSLYTALAKMYAEQKMYDQSVSTYNKAAAMDPKNFGVASGMGIVKFNQGVDKYNESVNAKNAADADKYLAEAKTIWKDATKILESALALPRTNNDREDLRASYDALQQMYYRTQDPVNGKKYKELRDQN